MDLTMLPVFLAVLLLVMIVIEVWGKATRKKPAVRNGIIAVPSESWDEFSECLGILSNYSDSKNVGRGKDVNLSFEYGMDFDISYDQVLVKWQLQGPPDKVEDVAEYLDREVSKVSKHAERAIFSIKGAGSE